MEVEIITGTKKINYQGLSAYLPVLIIKDKSIHESRTIKTIHISTGDPLVNKKDALKYADIWRNESLERGFITYS